MQGERGWQKLKSGNGYTRYLNGGKKKGISATLQDYVYIEDGCGYVNVNYSIDVPDENKDYVCRMIKVLARKHFNPLFPGKHLIIPNATVLKDTLNKTRMQYFFKYNRGNVPTNEEFERICEEAKNFKEELLNASKFF